MGVVDEGLGLRMEEWKHLVGIDFCRKFDCDEKWCVFHFSPAQQWRWLDFDRCGQGAMVRCSTLLYFCSSNLIATAFISTLSFYLILHRFPPNNNNHVRRKTHPLLRFHHNLSKQLSPLRPSA